MLGAATFAGAANAQDLAVADAGGQMAAIGMIARAERIVHHREPYLLVRLSVQNLRSTRRTDGTYASTLVGAGAVPYLPVRVACDAAALAVGGQRQEAHVLSPCREPTLVPAPFAPPVFLVFRYPRPGTANVTIPVTVLPPVAPVTTRMDAPPPPALTPAQTALLGERVLTMSVVVPEKR